jgi:serine phosphatase RsbU (regulator of sigma subunit)
VTAFAAIIDLETGGVVYCNAGHEDPFRIAPGDAAAGRLSGGDGPPLCAVDDFAYRGARAQLKDGELVCIVTDGVTEACSPENALYGSARIAALLQAGAFAGDPARTVVDALVADVTRFASGAAQADDLTVLALRWNGPATRAS